MMVVLPSYDIYAFLFFFEVEQDSGEQLAVP
jgi:hypothetical protein